MKHFVEIRSLNLKDDKRAEFHRLFTEQSLPLLKRWNIDVVTNGPSLHDDNTYYVIRCYDTLAQRDIREDTFYGSDDWRYGPREAMLSLIDNYTDVVLELDEVAVQAMRSSRS